jgi:PepSY-associated TM region
MKLRRFVRQLHRWIGLLIAAQLVLWVFGGLVMSALRLEEVKGEDRVASRPVEPLATAGLLAPAQVVDAQGAAVSSLALVMLDGQPVYRLKAGSEQRLVDARSGARLSPLPRELAERLARADYAGPAEIAGVDWVDTPGMEYRERGLPLWRVRFADDRATALYVSPASGDIVARRNDLWRLFDFVWMLHIMDYEDREDFNHPLLIVTAASALLFLFTGLAMLVFSFRPTRP